MAPTLAMLVLVALVAALRDDFIETDASEVDCTALLGPEQGPRWKDCDGDASNGCETFVFGDVQNCGWCHHECYNVTGAPLYRTRISCYGGLCQYRCDPMTKVCDDDLCDPYSKDCHLDLSNGCEADINQSDPHNCGYLPDAITEVPPDQGYNFSDSVAPNGFLSNRSSVALLMGMECCSLQNLIRSH